MAIGPKQFDPQSQDTTDLEVVEMLEKLIDAQLSKGQNPSGRDQLIFTLGDRRFIPSAAAIAELQKRYEDAGWAGVAISMTGPKMISVVLSRT